jgi:hypothetical protein
VPTNELDAVFYVGRPPRVELREGMFHICFESGGLCVSLVMSPNNFLKMRRLAKRVEAEFLERKGVIDFER